jgi:hypothetical protein
MKLGVTLDILNQKDTPAFYADTLANRPAAGFTGRVFISTDTLDLYRDTGTTWVLLSPSSTGTITGSGAAGQVTYFSAASSITGSNNLFWDTANNRLGVNTNTPSATFDVHGTTNIIAQLNQLTTGQNALLTFMDNSVGKWRLGNIYNAAANDFGIVDITNTLQRFTIKNTGQTFIGAETASSGLFVVNSSTSDSHIVAIGATAPSIRVRNAGTAPTQQFGLGLATGVNNFIQGSASGDFCLFNGSTTASPILLGIYDAVAVSVQEAARVSAARNFLVGTTTDSGQKLIVNGTALITGAITSSGITSTGTNTMLSASSSTQGLIVRGGSSVGTASLASGQILIGQTTTYRGSIAYDDNIGAMYIDNLYDNANSNIYIRTRTLGTPINALTILGSGNVGIGVSTPTAKLQIAGDYALMTTTGSNLNWELTNGTVKTIYGVEATNSTSFFGSQTNHSLVFRVNNTEQARITTAGNLIIGTTTDGGQKLQVNGSAIINTTFTSLGAINAYAGINGFAGVSQNLLVDWSGESQFTTLTATNLFFGTNAQRRLTIKSSGVINITSIPTSAVGLVSGDIYSNAGILTIVP